MEIVRGLIHSNVKPAGSSLVSTSLGGEAALESDRPPVVLLRRWSASSRAASPVCCENACRACDSGSWPNVDVVLPRRSSAASAQSRPAERNADEHARQEVPLPQTHSRGGSCAAEQAETGISDCALGAFDAQPFRASRAPANHQSSAAPMAAKDSGSFASNTPRICRARRRLVDDDLGAVVVVEPCDRITVSCPLPWKIKRPRAHSNSSSRVDVHEQRSHLAGYGHLLVDRERRTPRTRSLTCRMAS